MSATAIKASFKKADPADSGRITKELCLSVLRELDKDWPEDFSTMLFEMFPIDNGTLDYNKFVDWLCSDGDLAQSMADVVIERIASSLALNGLTTLQLFEKHDCGGKGVLTRPEVESVLIKFQPDLSAKDLESIFQVFDKNGDLTIDTAEFCGCLDQAAEKSSLVQKQRKVSNARRGSNERARRDVIHGESVSEESIKNYKAPQHPKSDEAKKVIMEALQSNSKMNVLGLSRLAGADMDEMVMAFRQRTIAKDEDVIKQGEDGDCLYVIEEGTFDIYVARPADDGTLGRPAKVATFIPGMLFGELALMYSAPRAATVRCVTPDALVWALDREPFQMLLRRCGVEMQQQYNGWLKDVDILKKSMNLYEISLVADAGESVLYDPAEEVFKQGSKEQDAVYILEDGAFEAVLESDGGEQVVKRYETQGDYFGELALVTSEPRKLTVRAAGDAVAFKIEKEAFEKLLIPIHEQLKAHAAEYPELSSFRK